MLLPANCKESPAIALSLRGEVPTPKLELLLMGADLGAKGRIGVVRPVRLTTNQAPLVEFPSNTRFLGEEELPRDSVNVANVLQEEGRNPALNLPHAIHKGEVLLRFSRNGDNPNRTTLVNSEGNLCAHEEGEGTLPYPFGAPLFTASRKAVPGS